MVELVATAQASADALPVTRVCRALGLSRATYDRWRPAAPRPDRDRELRAQHPGDRSGDACRRVSPDHTRTAAARRGGQPHSACGA